MFRRKKIKSNAQFIIEHIEAIEEDFSKNFLYDLIVNYKNSEIVGFFIVLNKKSMDYRECKRLSLPTISHELDFDEFFDFLVQHNSPENLDAHTKIMRKHKEYLC